jgi:nitrogen fixation protein NifQ
MAVTGEDVYRWLVSGGAPGQGALCQGFDTHVVASILSIALMETRTGASLVAATGLDPAELKELAQLCFPHAEPVFARIDPSERLTRVVDEACLQELLFRGSSERSRLEYFLSCMIARRAQHPNHLWQDLGLRRRRELSWLMQAHFAPLATRNKQNMRWKKFLYRLICRDEGFTICPAPSCEECDDVQTCFGEESGQSLLSQSQQTS